MKEKKQSAKNKTYLTTNKNNKATTIKAKQNQ
jgi:hypothetical protein